jgi:hypothetical protein
MYIHPEIARRLAQTKIEEAQSRLSSLPVRRAASLDRPATGTGLRFRLRRHRPKTPAKADVGRARPASRA